MRSSSQLWSQTIHANLNKISEKNFTDILNSLLQLKFTTKKQIFILAVTHTVRIKLNSVRLMKTKKPPGILHWKKPPATK